MQSRVSFFVLAMSMALLAVSGLGCPSSSSNCNVDNPCDVEGDVRCADDATLETCTLDADDCLGWVESACAAGTACEEGAEGADCVATCDHECDPAAHPACGADGVSIETCELQDDGCYDLVATDCDPDLVCDDSGEEPVCTCVDDCDPDMYPACSEDFSALETCLEGLDGCFDLVVTDCGAGELCEDDGQDAECVVQCADDCDPADYPACSANGFAVETCEEQADGCNDVVVTDCPMGEACNADTFACEASGCSDDCDPIDYPACGGDGTSIDACERQADGCYDLLNVACGAEEICDASGGAPQCTCVNDCDPALYPACSIDAFAVVTCIEGADGCYDMLVTDCGAGETCNADTFACESTGCSNDCVPGDYPACGGDGTSIDACELQADNCYDLVNTACGAEEVCDDSGAAPVCTCVDDCDPNAYPACSDDNSAVEDCIAGADGCYDVEVTACENDDVCDPDTFTCVAPCQDECVEADYPVCSVDNLAIETCEQQADGCTDLISTACGADLICDASGGQPECVCTDDCVEADYPVCSVDNLAIETCEQQADGCFDLISTPCGADLVCDPAGGGPSCECVDDCNPASFPACTGDNLGVETCEQQADGCYDLITTACGFSETCDADSFQCVLDANCEHVVTDGSFESGIPTTDWMEYSSIGGSPFCTTDSCGDLSGNAYARTGDNFFWVGGLADGQEGSASQEVRIPLGATATLRLYLYIPSTSAEAGDVFEVLMDADVLFTVDGTQTAPYENGYVLLEFDVSAYSDGYGHTLTLYSLSNGTGGNGSIINILADDVSLIACDGTCVHECDTVDELACSVDRSEIWICQANDGTCNTWALDTACAAGDRCNGLVDPPVCFTPVAGTPGDSCDDPFLEPLDAPAMLPYSDLSQTNCGRGDNYDQTCLGSYDGGEDILYQINVTEPTAFNITLDPKGTSWTGMAVDMNCPLSAACYFGATNSESDAYSTGCQAYEPGLYTLMIDTYPSPDCIPDFDLAIDTCVCGQGQTTCLDGTTIGVCNAAGDGFDAIPCGESCGEVAPGDFRCYVSPDAAGELVITEIIQNPSAVSDSDGEWFEVYNPAAEPANLNGLVVQDDGSDSFTVDVDVFVPSMGFAVLGRNDDPGTNGGLTVAYAYGSQMTLANGADEVEIIAGGTTIDRVAYDGNPDNWPDPTGASMSLTGSVLDAGINDNGGVWCEAVDAFGDGDLGTPGAGNPICPFTATFFSDDLEADPGWTIAGDWEYGVPDAVSLPDGPAGCAGDSAGCYGTVMAADYSNSTDYETNSVTFGPVDLSAVPVAGLSFDLWLQTEDCCDSARVEVSADGSVWEVAPAITPMYDDAAPAWDGDIALSWTPAVCDLTPWVGGDVWVRFVLESDGSITRPGMYVDNVAIEGY